MLSMVSINLFNILRSVDNGCQCFKAPFMSLLRRDMPAPSTYTINSVAGAAHSNSTGI